MFHSPTSSVLGAVPEWRSQQALLARLGSDLKTGPAVVELGCQESG